MSWRRRRRRRKEIKISNGGKGKLGFRKREVESVRERRPWIPFQMEMD